MRWQKEVGEVREDRGGEQAHIWNLQYTKEKEDEEKARVTKQLEEEKRRKQMQIDFTARELLKRIARVERLSKTIKSQNAHPTKLPFKMSFNDKRMSSQSLPRF
jgi:hypothetical protein